MAQNIVTTSFFLLSSLVFLLATIHGTHAFTFEVTINGTNPTAGARFTKDVGIDYTKQVLANATNFIWKLFGEKNPAETRGYENVTLVVDNMEDGIGVTVGNAIQINAKWVENYVGDLKTDVTGVMFHESTHVWQWLGENANVAVVEGIADFVRLKAGLAPNPWLKPGEGNNWDEGYAVTARFFEYLESLKVGFIAQLNKKMKDKYSDTFFVDLLGKPVDQLWKQYKAKYNRYNHTN